MEELVLGYARYVSSMDCTFRNNEPDVEHREGLGRQCAERGKQSSAGHRHRLVSFVRQQVEQIQQLCDCWQMVYN
jgi:hypothetical protein